MRLSIGYDGDADHGTGQFPPAVWRDALDKGATIQVTVTVTPDVVRDAVLWGRKLKYTNERDGELGMLLEAYYSSGLVSPFQSEIDVVLTEPDV